MEHGGQSVTTIGTFVMPLLYAESWDTQYFGEHQPIIIIVLLFSIYV